MYFYKPVVLPDRHIPISYHSLPLFSSKGVNTKAVEARATPFHWRASSNMADVFFCWLQHFSGAHDGPRQSIMGYTKMWAPPDFLRRRVLFNLAIAYTIREVSAPLSQSPPHVRIENMASRSRSSTSISEDKYHFSAINESPVDDISLEFFYQPHTVTLLTASVLGFVYVAFTRWVLAVKIFDIGLLYKCTWNTLAMYTM